MKMKLLGVVAVWALLGVVSPAYSVTGFIYSNGTYTNVFDPLGMGTWAFGINNSGQVVGAYNTCNNCGYQYGYLYSNGSYTTINVPGSTATWAFGINDSGQIVGNYLMNNNIYNFLYSNGTYTTLSNPTVPNDSFVQGINNAGQIVGQYNTGSAQFGFVSSINGTYTTLNNSVVVTEAFGINDAGKIVGMYRNDATGADLGFMYDTGNYTSLSAPPAPNNTWATDINNLDQIVGLADGTAFLYSAGTYTLINLGGYTEAFGINDAGQIVGDYLGGPTPLPTALPLFVTGLGALGLLSWRRKRKQVA
jgi:probable HAF family extracellular repeat protein